jgi:hypothetical protein
MKSRSSFVSNSSSSSFILRSKDYPSDSYLPIAISDNCFYVEIYGLDISKWPKEEMITPTWTIKYPELDEDERDDECMEKYLGFDLKAEGCPNTYHSFGDLNRYCDLALNRIFKTLKENSKFVRLCTGGTDSRVEPQLFLQCVLIDNNVDYRVLGDGSFDLRDPREVGDILKHNDFDKSGAVVRVLKEFSSQK